MQNIWVADLHLVRRFVQKVEEILDGVRRLALLSPPDGPEQVLHVGVHRHLRRREGVRIQWYSNSGSCTPGATPSRRRWPSPSDAMVTFGHRVAV